MKRSVATCGVLALACVSVSAGGIDVFPNTGPDVIVGEIFNPVRWGREGQITAFTFGSVHCNAGDTNVNWIAHTNQHPVSAQHLYRLKDGRFEMIGQSWVSHGLTTLAESICAGLFGYGCNGQAGSVLGVGCSHVHSGSYNGAYTFLGPKHEVNPLTGHYSYPFGSFANDAPIGKRLQVHDDDLRPETNDGALYFIEVHYVSSDDALAGNGLNNASYRPIAVTESSPDEFVASFIPGHPTQRQLPAIHAWQQVHPAVVINTVDVADDGRFILGYDVTDNGNGTWTYEYALHNFNSERSGGSFAVPVAQHVNVTDIDFKDVSWHSGAPYDDTPWTVEHADGMLTWSTQSHAENPNANALRWGTLYNFRFVADAPPIEDDLVIGLFKPTEGDGPTTAVIAGVRPQPDILGDLNNDAIVDVTDLLDLLGQWGQCAPACPADLNNDGTVDVTDLLQLLGNWG